MAYEKLLNEIYAAVSLKYLWPQYQPGFIKSESPDWINEAMDFGMEVSQALVPEDGKTEYFIEGTEPKSVCDVHVKVAVNSANNKLANDNTPANLLAEKVFIKKPNANPNAADYPFVVPTQQDDTKPEEKIKLSEIGLYQNMDLYDAIAILHNREIKYSFNGLSVSGSINPGEYTLTSFTPEIKTGDTVKLTIKATTNTPDESIGESPNTDDDDDNNDD